MDQFITLAQIRTLLLSLPVVFFALSVHEFAHAYVSKRLGDPTAERAGRLTLLPWAHLDPFGTLMLIISRLSGFGFGWAKPVPINPSYYRNPAQGVFLVSLAGPAANFVTAVPFGLLMRLPLFSGFPPAVRELIFSAVLINLGLFLFNLIPVPPLDGSGILAYFLHGRARYRFQMMQRYGFVILLALIMTGLVNRILIHPFIFLFRLLTGR
ncbi:MAG: site-2 protease family protein [Patescibacteria group bacterium]